MGTQRRSGVVAAILCVALLAVWAPDLTVNRLWVTAAVAFVGGALVERPRWLGLALVVAFAGGVAAWLRVESIPAYVVVGSVGRWAGFAVVAAGIGRLLAAGMLRVVTAR